MITKIQLPKKDKDFKGEQPHKSGSTRILASIPKKMGRVGKSFQNASSISSLKSNAMPLICC